MKKMQTLTVEFSILWDDHELWETGYLKENRIDVSQHTWKSWGGQPTPEYLRSLCSQVMKENSDAIDVMVYMWYWENELSMCGVCGKMCDCLFSN